MVITVALAATYGLWVLFTGSPALPSYSADDDQVRIDVLRLVFYAVAGIGGVVALTIAYRRQRLHEAAERRDDTRLFNERFTAAAEQLASEQAANRLAGVYTMARLADDWNVERQTCVDVLCAYLRMPYDPPRLRKKPTDEEVKEYKQVRQEQQVRHAILDVIAERLCAEPVEGKTWHWCDFNFMGATLDDINFANATFFGDVLFNGASFPEGHIYLGGVKFHDGVGFHKSKFNGGFVDFSGVEFKGQVTTFALAQFTDGTVIFHGASFDFEINNFVSSDFTGGRVEFGEAGRGFKTLFRSGRVDFEGVCFEGAEVDFRGVEFGPAIVDMRKVADWSVPPTFDEFPDGPPDGLLLPTR
ncbi:pentapeptide repeat-containing protein [Glycomyces tenuis]|uniref:pentapeptide repeat-containing protein n=1 Tax=Glycomyces tenuis TaxID=58116 RepID=UPI0012DFE1AF|nr:pentapeptide repeat-containing protein [Glycomyces tenuis]